MPTRLVLHEADAFTFHRVSEKHDWMALHGPCLFEGIDNLSHVMAIQTQHIPSETPVLVGERLNIHHIFDEAVDLKPIAIDDANQIVECVMAGFHRRFPHLTFLFSPSPMMQKILCFFLSRRAASAMPTAML